MAENCLPISRKRRETCWIPWDREVDTAPCQENQVFFLSLRTMGSWDLLVDISCLTFISGLSKVTNDMMDQKYLNSRNDFLITLQVMKYEKVHKIKRMMLKYKNKICYMLE